MTTDISTLNPKEQDELFIKLAKEHGMVIGEGAGVTHQGKYRLDEYGRKMIPVDVGGGKIEEKPERALRAEWDIGGAERPRIHAVGLETEIGNYETEAELARAYCRHNKLGPQFSHKD